MMEPSSGIGSGAPQDAFLRPEEVDIFIRKVAVKFCPNIRNPQWYHIPTRFIKIIFTNDEVTTLWASRRKWEYLEHLADKYQIIVGKYLQFSGRDYDEAGETLAFDVLQWGAVARNKSEPIDDESLLYMLSQCFQGAQRTFNIKFGKFKEEFKQTFGAPVAERLIETMEEKLNERLRAVSLSDPYRYIHYSYIYNTGFDVVQKVIYDYQDRLFPIVKQADQLLQEHACYLEALVDIAAFVIGTPVSSFEEELQITHFSLESRKVTRLPNWKNVVETLARNLASEFGCKPEQIETIIHGCCQDLKQALESLQVCADPSKRIPLDPVNVVRKAFEAKRKILASCNPKEFEKKTKQIDQHEAIILKIVEGLQMQGYRQKIFKQAEAWQVMYSQSSIELYNHIEAKRIHMLLIEHYGSPDTHKVKPLSDITWGDIGQWLTIPSYCLEPGKSQKVLNWELLDKVILELFAEFNIDSKKRERLKKDLFEIIKYFYVDLPQVQSKEKSGSDQPRTYLNIKLRGRSISALVDLPKVVAMWNITSPPSLKAIIPEKKIIPCTSTLICGYLGRIITRGEGAIPDLERGLDEAFAWLRRAYDNEEFRKLLLTELKLWCEWLDSTMVKAVISSSFILETVLINRALSNLEDNMHKNWEEGRKKWLEWDQLDLKEAEAKLKEATEKKNFPETRSELYKQHQSGELTSDQTEEVLVRMKILDEIAIAEWHVNEYKVRVAKNSIETPPLGKVIAELYRTLLKTHGTGWFVDLASDFRSFLVTFKEALEKLEDPTHKKVLSLKDKEKVLKKYLQLRKRFFESIQGIVAKMKTVPLEARLLTSLKPLLEKFQIDPTNLDFTQQLFERIFVPFVEDWLKVPGFFPPPSEVRKSPA